MNQKLRKDSTSGFRGVSMTASGKWVAYLNYKGRRVWTKTFDTKTQAAHTYNEKAIEYFGAFARLNIMPCSQIHP